MAKYKKSLIVTLGMYAAIVAGCASDNGGDPGALALPSGQNCKSTLSELKRMDRQGVPSKIERANAGKKISAKDRAAVDRYNKLLNQYLGARCHA